MYSLPNEVSCLTTKQAAMNCAQHNYILSRDSLLNRRRLVDANSRLLPCECEEISADGRWACTADPARSSSGKSALEAAGDMARTPLLSSMPAETTPTSGGQLSATRATATSEIAGSTSDCSDLLRLRCTS